MDVSYILDPLNDGQREAVTCAPGPVLVLAGAGSGKTRVLVHRMAWLLALEEVSANGILAVTFTNKAAGEMRGRIEDMLGIPTRGLWVGTFHGLAHKLLRMHWQDAGLPESFQILDSDDQQRVIKRILKTLEIDDKRWPARQAQNYINARKDEGLRAENVTPDKDLYSQQMLRIYQAYEEVCNRSGLLDFAELLLRAYELWQNNPYLLDHYRERFQHILVDEFQDTNTIQYAWLRLIAGPRANIFVVGDDDQSIYGWRGARVEHIQRFSKDFEGARLVRLEQNYRSTQTILSAANALISHNQGRLGKELWTGGDQGDPIQLYAAFNDLDEARYVVERIREWSERDLQRSEMAILYRSNAQSRLFEESLIALGIPYRVYGGLRFFERMEIKDTLAYLRLIRNRNDDAALERVLNTPTRGIGERSLSTVREVAQIQQISLWHAINRITVEKQLNGRAVNALTGFTALIEQLEQSCKELELSEQVQEVIESSGLRDHFGREKGERAQSRLENLDELISAARGFALEWEPDAEDEQLDDLSAFLAHAALEAGEGQAEAWEDCVHLMTLHSAKGLEFPVVFVCGLEEKLFPHQMSMDEPGRLEEERRLCYVGMTRARKHLYLSYAETRRLHGSESYQMPSRFIREIPSNLIEEVRPKVQISRPTFVRRDSTPYDRQQSFPMKLGQRVSHAKFGEGVVLNFEGEGSHARVQVNFEQAGSKWLVLAYANLETV